MKVHNGTKSLRVYEHESPGLSIQIDNPEAWFEGGVRFLMHLGKHLRA